MINGGLLNDKVTIILSMAYPVIKILHYDSVEVLGSDD